jgi:hypothetical protein
LILVVRFVDDVTYLLQKICFHTAAFLGQQDFLLDPIQLKALFSIYCLVLGRPNIVLQVHNTWQLFSIHKTQFSSLYPSPELTYSGVHHHLLTFHLNTPRVTGIPPFVVISLSLK